MNTITCTQLDDLLFDGSELAMQTAARHAAECEACAERLAEWNDISGTARSMQTTWTNETLWPRIERALRAETRSRPQRAWMRVAAAVFVVVSLAATMMYALRVQTRDAAFDENIIRLSAMDEVERAEQAHVDAIRRLEKVAAPKLEDEPTPLMISYKEKLMLLDDAIAECQANIDRNRQNAHLREQLLAMYSEKQQTLKDVVREDNP